MTLKSLDVLKKGLSRITQSFKICKDELNAKLAQKEGISSSDEYWLDHEGNTVNEQCVIETLEAASDYECAVEGLDKSGKAIVKKLREWAGDLAKVAGKKRKLTFLSSLFCRSDLSDIFWLGLEHEKEAKVPKEKAKSSVTPVFTKKENSTLQQHIEILDWHHKNGKNQSETAQHFSPIYPNLQIKQPLILRWMKEETKIHEQWEQVTHQTDRTAKRAQQTEHPKVSEMMSLWVSKAMGDGILLTGDVLCQKWNTFTKLVGIPEEDQLKLSNGWLAHFKERHGLREMRQHGEAASATPSTVEEEKKQIQELIKKYGYQSHCQGTPSLSYSHYETRQSRLCSRSDLHPNSLHPSTQTSLL